MRRTAEFKLKNAALLDNLMPIDEEKSLLENNVVNVLVDRDQKGRRILLTHNGCKYFLPTSILNDQISWRNNESEGTVNSILISVLDKSKGSASRLHPAHGVHCIGRSVIFWSQHDCVIQSPRQLF